MKILPGYRRKKNSPEIPSELSKKIRSDYPQTKIILMTAFETPETIAELDIEAFLEKPVHAEDLLKIINN